MLVSMTDLLESGRVDEQLAMLDEFERRAATQRSPLYDVYADFLRSCRLLVTGEYDAAEALANQALAAGLSSHGVNTQMAHAGQMFCIAWDRGQLGEIVELVELTAATNEQAPIWRVALVACLAAAGRTVDAQRAFDELVTADGVALPDDSLYFTGVCFLVEAARVLGDSAGAAVLRRALEPYAERMAVTGLGGVAIGPVARYVGVAAHTAGDARCRRRPPRAVDRDRRRSRDAPVRRSGPSRPGPRAARTAATTAGAAEHEAAGPERSPTRSASCSGCRSVAADERRGPAGEGADGQRRRGPRDARGPQWAGARRAAQRGRVRRRRAPGHGGRRRCRGRFPAGDDRRVRRARRHHRGHGLRARATRRRRARGR